MKKFTILLILLLAACSSSYPIATITPTFSFTATPSFPATPVLLSPTPTLKPLPICPKLNNPSIPVAPSKINFLWVKQTIIDYLTQGGDPEKLAYELATPEYGNLDVKMDRVDTNNDGVDELIFSSGIFLSDSDGVDSGLWVFKCENGNYRIPYQIEYIGAGYESNPKFMAAVDLNNDNKKEIVIRFTWHGSGCLQRFNIFSWEEDYQYTTHVFVNQHFPCETGFALGNKDSNGNYEILFEGKSDIRYDSVAYIQRDFVDTYKLNNQLYVLKSHEYLPSPYRVYAIYDSQQALNKGDIHEAIQLYDKAAHDEMLQDVDSLAFNLDWYIEKLPKGLSKQDHPREYVSAFSLFRLTVLYFETHEESKARSVLNELETSYSNEKPGSEFTNVAQYYIKQRKIGNNPFESCQAVSSMIENKYPYLDWHFKWSTWTSFDYTNQTLCPYSSER